MLRLTLKTLLFVLVSGIICLGGLTLYILPNLPDIETLKDVKMQLPLQVYTHDNTLIAEFGEKRRRPVKIENLPPHLINAVLAAEDDRFYQHPGVDWQGIVRAVLDILKTGKKGVGGSTITMQVAKNFFTSAEKSYIRKLKDILLALKIEQELSKDEILELYMNKIYLGQRAYGVGAAAQVYYGEDINNLELAQLAMIAGIAQRPSPNNPVTSPERATVRRNYVLGRMLEQGYISANEYKLASQAPVTASLHSPVIDLDAPYIAEMARNKLVEMYGEDAYNDGYKVYTSIRNNNQQAANQALRNALHEYDRRHGYRGAEHHYDLPDESNEAEWLQLLKPFPEIGGLYPALVIEVEISYVIAYILGTGPVYIEWSNLEWARKYITENRRGPVPETAAEILRQGDIIRVSKNEENKWMLMQLPEVEGALVSMDPNDGAILSLVGGYDFQRSKFNRITQAKRQPGSSFKPFIYSAALESGFTAASLINDAPVVFDDPGIEDRWRPENFSGKYYGPTRIREAIIHSRNLVSIRLLNEIGVAKALKHIARFGYDTDQLPHGLSLALGSGEVTPWQHIIAYSVLANGGFRVNPYFIERIENSRNEVIYQTNPITVCNRQQQESVAEPTQQSIPGTPASSMKLSPTDMASAGQDDNPAHSEPLSFCAERVVDPGNVWIISDMTRDVIQNPSGTGRRARVLGRKDLSGKTGTTNDQRDAWFAGFNNAVVTVSWVGFDDYLRKLGDNETGGVAALPMWIEYMRTALEGIPEKIPDRPPGLVNIRIDPKTGKPANAGDPYAIFEVFRIEHVPGGNHGETVPDTFQGENTSENVSEQLF
jgi:penicillin-binding protein 1A